MIELISKMYFKMSTLKLSYLLFNQYITKLEQIIPGRSGVTPDSASCC